jgi:hypothetical protein
MTDHVEPSREAVIIDRARWEAENNFDGHCYTITQDAFDALLDLAALTPPVTVSEDAVERRMLGYHHMRSGGRCDWTHLREAVAEATTGSRAHSKGFDPDFYPGHQMVEGINYNSLDRIVTAFVDAALSTLPQGVSPVDRTCNCPSNIEGHHPLCIENYRGKEVSPALMDEVSLAECPVGLFWCGDTLALKTEYGNNDGRIDAYIVDSGEFFWGEAPQTIASQRAQRVVPIDTDIARTLLSKLTPRGEGTAEGIGAAAAE